MLGGVVAAISAIANSTADPIVYTSSSVMDDIMYQRALSVDRCPFLFGCDSRLKT